MAGQSAFDRQQLQDISPMSGSGLLEQLNFPPVVIRYIRKNKKSLQIATVVAGLIVIFLVLFNSYQANRIQKASAALAAAMQASELEKYKALTAVGADFSGTSAANWAKTELAHGLMKTGNYKEAVTQYEAVKIKISGSDPLFSLLTFALAQANEAAGLIEAAILEYKALQKIEGYQDEGFSGLARIYESQGNGNEALAVYEQYLATFTGQDQNNPARKVVEDHIARLKARL